MSFIQLLRVVPMGPFVWLMDGLLMKAEWRYAPMECGGQCVTLAGMTMMPELCADNWVTASAQVYKLGTRLVICKDRNCQLASCRIIEQPIKLHSGIY